MAELVEKGEVEAPTETGKQGFFASKTAQFWIGTVIGGAVIGLVGSALNKYTEIRIISVKKAVEATTDFSIEIIKTPASSLKEAQDRKDKLERLKETMPNIELGGVIRSADEFANKELNLFKEKKIADDAAAASKEKEDSANKTRLEDEKKAAEKQAALDKARQDEINRLNAIEAEKKRAEAAIAAEIAQGKRFDEMLQKQGSKSK
jgi:hypothetical protein